ncbi:hypothetical protein DFP72DRAFT_883540 [Ephemerocybe angulata]|uniref:MI domain-containing protein n=1 Tax=Ephemerocybe angulata TaxID=980116 RepID=A0A8H6MDN8_9AGAR|nr:hypothetical protein DFP72DRAFT_883540 [Tulosesus angulatus]
MSKSSTGSSAKPLPAKSAWSKGPPQTSAPSPRSQSPAPSAQSQSHLTHSRRPSALGQAVPIKDGVSIPRNNVGAAAAKQGSPVTFGSIDDASAPISSSPAAPNPIKESVVKSFGTVPAAPATPSSHINGKPSISASRPTGPPLTTPSTSSSGAPSESASASATPATTSSGHKLVKPDIKKLFQSPSAPATSTNETQSPSLRPANLPSQQQQSHNPPSSSQPQFGGHYTTFVPNRQPAPPSGPNNATRSPVYPRQMPNGSGGRSQPPNGGQPGLSSPRLGPPHTPQQAGGPQPPAPVPGQVQQQYWPGYYYPAEYMGYPPPQWGYVPGMPPQSAHPAHHAQPPHMQPHPTMPMSPRNAPQHLPSTPTMSHATPNPVHPPHPPPPLTHTTSNISSVSSPPPTPSTARLNPGSSAFVPRPTSKIVLKDKDGKEIALESLTKTAASPAHTSVSSSGQASPYRGSSPSTPKRASIRMESEEQRKKRLAEEEEKEKEKQRAQAEAEEKIKKQKEEEERKVKEEEERKKKEEEEREQARKDAEEKERVLKAEEERKKQEEEERKKKEEEEKVRLRTSKLRKEEEERQRKLKEEEEQRTKEERKVKVAEVNGETQTSDVKKSLRIDTATPTSNAADLGKRPRPGPLDLTAAKTSRQSSLSTARNIVDINGVKYPEGISSPRPELNENAKPGHFRYDRDFLLQFMAICKEKPPSLPPLDAIGLEPIDQATLMMSRGGSGRHRNTSGAPPPSRQASMGLGFGGPGKAGGANFAMGSFAAPGKLTSEERFSMANNGARSASGSAAVGIPFGRAGGPTPMQRTASQGGRDRTRSKRGEKRPPAEGGRGYQHDRGGSYAQQQNQMDLGPVAPLQPTANRWDRKAVGAVDVDSPELVDRKVKGLLNKLTMEKFDSISDQIITWANKSEQEKDGRTLIQVIRLVFEKATDEAAWSEMYARLCRKMMERISPKGKPIAGGQLFRKYLLNRCQEDFERGWAAKEATALAAVSKGAEDDAVKAANQGKDAETEEKAKRQGLGLIKFIGELFKLQMLTERIMHECVKKLLGNVENPEEEEIESLCKLLATVGAILDTPKARAHMDIYFGLPNVSSRMQFMLQDLLELRERKWIPRNAAAAPTTLAQVHENAAKEKLAAEKDNLNRQSNMSRTSSNRGRGRNDFEQQGPDGWAVAGGAPRPPPKAGDLSNFGKIQKTQPMTFGPSSVFSKKDAKAREPISRSSSNSNMFSMLSQQADAAAESKAEPTQRRRLVLAPRTVPKEEGAPTASASGEAGSESGSDVEEEAAAPSVEMSDADANKKIDEDIKELFAVRNLDEAEVYFTGLPAKHHSRLIDKIVTKAVESKATDAELVASFFERASSKELASSSSFESGFESIAEFIFDIAVDAPMAPKLFAQMVKGAGLSEQARQQLASKAEDNDKLLALLS